MSEERGEDSELVATESSTLTGFKVDIHCHILPKRWPDLKEVSLWEFRCGWRCSLASSITTWCGLASSVTTRCSSELQGWVLLTPPFLCKHNLLNYPTKFVLPKCIQCGEQEWN